MTGVKRCPTTQCTYFRNALPSLFLMFNVLNSKVKLSPTIALQVAKGEMMYSSSFLTSALDGVSGQRHALAALYPWGKDPPSTRWIGGWVGLRADLNTETKVKSFASAGFRTPFVQSVVRHYDGWVTPGPCCLL